MEFFINLFYRPGPRFHERKKITSRSRERSTVFRQSVLSTNINSPIGGLFVLINQSFCDYLIDAKQMPNILFTNFSTELKKQIGGK